MSMSSLLGTKTQSSSGIPSTDSGNAGDGDRVLDALLRAGDGEGGGDWESSRERERSRHGFHNLITVRRTILSMARSPSAAKFW